VSSSFSLFYLYFYCTCISKSRVTISKARSPYSGKNLSYTGFNGLSELAGNDGYVRVTFTRYLLSFIIVGFVKKTPQS
jgi:hypothetical protein